MDLQRRMRKNPFYSEAIKLLGRAGFHLTRPSEGPSGGINVEVFVCDRQGRESIKTFFFPAAMQGMAMMQWKVGFQRNIDELNRSGLFPSRKQFDLPKDEPVKQPEAPAPALRLVEPEPPSDEVVTAEQVALHEEFDSEETPPAPVPMVVISIKSDVGTLVTLIGLHDRVTFSDGGARFEAELLVPQTQLSEFLQSVGQSSAEFLQAYPEGQKPQKPRASVIREVPEAIPVSKGSTRSSRFPITPALMEVWKRGNTMTAREIIEAIMAKYPNAPGDYLKTKVPQTLAAMVKAKTPRVKRVRAGQYMKIRA